MMEEQSLVSAKISQAIHELFNTSSGVITAIVDSVNQSRQTQSQASN